MFCGVVFLLARILVVKFGVVRYGLLICKNFGGKVWCAVVLCSYLLVCWDQSLVCCGVVFYLDKTSGAKFDVV